MLGSAIPLRRLWRPTLAVAGPTLVVLLALWALDDLPGRTAIVAILLAVVGTGFAVRILLSDLAAIGEYATAVTTDTDARRPRLVFGDTLVPLVAGIRRLSRAGIAAGQSRDGASRTSGLDRLPDPVLMLDANRQVVRDNAAARELLGPSLAGRDLAAVLRNPAILEAVDAVLEGEEAIVDVEFSFQVPVERHFSARIARISDTDQQPVAVVIALHDLTVLKRAEEMRSDFVANASHELRTPISVLLGCIQTLRGSARDDPEAQAEFIGLMEGQAERMARLVDDLLSLSRIEMNEHAVPTRPVSLRQIAAQVVNDLQIKAEVQGIRIETEFSADLPDVPGDKDDLYRALQNLVDNALKYAAEDSTVTISARPASEDQLSQLSRNARYVAVSVKDRGEGIAPQHLPRLTERFYRVDTARSRQLGGTGLGLAIVKHVVNRHRGVLLIDSVLGEGSTFTIVLPSLAESAAAKPVQLPPPRPDANAPESA